MPAYVVALIHAISDAETYKRYVGQVEATLAPFGGRFIARKPDPELLEGGSAPSRSVILEFPSEAQARAWHDSPSYQPVMRMRQSASTGTLLLLPGYGAPTVAENDVYYVEMVSADVPATRALLEGTYGWRFQEMGPELGGSLVAVLPNGTRCGLRASMHEQEKPITRTYVRVADAKAAVARAEKLGAFVGLPPVELPGHGTIAIYFMGGVEIGVWQLP